MRAEAKRSRELKQFVFKIYKGRFVLKRNGFFYNFHLILSVKIYLCILKKFSTIKMLEVQNITFGYTEK
jgi:hypothetical protein